VCQIPQLDLLLFKNPSAFEQNSVLGHSHSLMVASIYQHMSIAPLCIQTFTLLIQRDAFVLCKADRAWNWTRSLIYDLRPWKPWW